VLGIGNTSSSSGWGGITPAASTLDVTARPSTGKAGKITRLTLPTAGTTTAWQDLAIAAGDGIIPATPVTAYAAGIYVRASVALKVMLSLQGMTADNKSAGSLNGPPVTLGAGDFGAVGGHDVGALVQQDSGVAEAHGGGGRRCGRRGACGEGGHKAE
jgi:hypothetical protein